METIKLSSQEKALIEIVRNLQFGEVRVIITDGKPIRVEEVKKSIKL
ncbi:DUF2292 domain-containing protein [Emergencia timonensis]|uniref:DUF2292 domain-containing protein n=1 Tax=Emergencia timonensis TaxID=1776384 RepID=A0A415DXC7_9FIRM|nr:DUF2292 domain-containing protein [Emergencia timonensis]